MQGHGLMHAIARGRGTFFCWLNALLIALNGPDSRVGSLTADWERFFEWKRIEREDDRKRHPEHPTGFTRRSRRQKSLSDWRDLRRRAPAARSGQLLSDY